MKKSAIRAPAVAASLFALLSGCAHFDRDRDARDYPPDARLPAEFVDSAGDVVGTAILKQTPNGVLMDVELRGLQPGWHGFHLHETGRCDTPDFTSAGEHFDPDGDEHGFESEDGYHAGDFPNIFISSDGRAQFQMFAERLTLGDGGNSMLDRDGTALVVHSGQDNYRAQPSGQSGDRVACAVITPDRDSER